LAYLIEEEIMEDILDSKDFRTHLPVMPVQNQPSWDSLQINGVVEKYLELKLEDLSKLSQSTVTADFECHDGWVAVDQKWEGVSVKALLVEAGVVSNTLNVVFNSGEYQLKLTVGEASEIDVIIALQLNGGILASGNGGPCRLIAGKRKGPAHVKWLQCITVTK
jgi:DMSO/TMAO reductase YedYZ molybdopterin-dependent catalytic subunit